jgi:hypothetical protein
MVQAINNTTGPEGYVSHELLCNSVVSAYINFYSRSNYKEIVTGVVP